MKYIYTPEEVRTIADALFRFMQHQGFNVCIEKPLRDDAPCATTLIATKGSLAILLEAQHRLICDQYIKDLSHWLNSNRLNAELFIIADRNTASFSGDFLKQLNQTGVGLILVEDDLKPTIERFPKNPALIISPEPTLRFGLYSKKVKSCIAKFNSPCSFLSTNNPRLDAARDMCEIVEGLTEELAIYAVKKKHITLAEKDIMEKDWAGQINTLGSQNVCSPGENAILNDLLKTDLHSFRGIRNLLDHKTRSRTQEIDRQQQLAERMMMGPRLIDRLVKMKRKL